MADIETTKRLIAVLGGNVQEEWQILEFLRVKWKCDGLHEIPAKTAREILARPEDFRAAVRRFHQMELCL